MRLLSYILSVLIIGICSCQRSVELSKGSHFTQLNPAKLGIDFVNQLHYDEDFNTYIFRSFYNGAGVGLGDLNNDGLLDLFFCGNQVDNKLYINQGDFQFEDVTQPAGVASHGAWSTGVSLVDINSDGWLDIYVCKSGLPEGENRHNELFINNGLDAQGIPTFTESAKAYGLADLGFSVHAVFFDFDKDDDLDMYLSNNSINPTDVVMDASKGLRDKRDPNGGNKLYRNDGIPSSRGGTGNGFTDISEVAGIYGSAIGFGLGVSVGDIDRDGWPDIFVANDFFEKDYLYINQGDGTFKESLEEIIDEISLGSMGVDIADVNNDGYPEIFVTEMLPDEESRLKTKTVFDNWDAYTLKVKNGYYRQFPRNVFQLNQGPAPIAIGDGVHFSEISRSSGVEATDWSWGAFMVDLDNDGFKEIFVTNGIVKDLLDQDYTDFY
ncbi:MAG: FG-GAP repeat domain-containing protein, partial [Cyclobacteriaceae bacterium]